MHMIPGGGQNIGKSQAKLTLIEGGLQEPSFEAIKVFPTCSADNRYHLLLNVAGFDADMLWALQGEVEVTITTYGFTQDADILFDDSIENCWDISFNSDNDMMIIYSLMDEIIEGAQSVLAEAA